MCYLQHLGIEMSERTTYNIKQEKKIKLERLALEASMKFGRMIKWTEIMEVLIDEYAKDAQQTIIHREEQKLKNEAPKK